MSIKISTFTNVISNPMNTHNFALDIPGFEDYAITVQSTTFPSEQFRTTVLYMDGEEVRYPTIPQNSGTWGFNVPETDDGSIGAALNAIKAQMWNQKSGAFTPDISLWRDITVTCRDLNSVESFCVVLHGAWLQGHNDIQLNKQSVETNFRYDWVVRYQWLEDLNLRGK